MNKLRKALVVILSSLFLLCASLFAACTTGSGKTQAQKPDDAVTPGQSEPAPEEKPGDPQEEACDINVEVNDETLGAYRLSGERTAKGGFKVGTPVTVTVEPNAGYEATLKVNGEEVPLDDDGSYTFTAQADTTVTVDYNYKYRILTTVLAGEGTITPAAPADGEKYAPGEVVQVEVTPAEGYIVDYVKVNGEEVEPGEDGKYTVEVTGRMYVVAEFVAVHTVTVENNGNGTVTLNDAAYEAPIENVKDGTVYTLQVTPADGEEIKAVYVNGALTSLDAENKATITVKADTLIKVVYVGQYTLTVPDDSNVVVKVDGSDAQASYKEGTVLHITVSAAEGYQLTDVTVKVGETPVEAVGGVYTVTMSANVTVEATAEALSEVETHAVTLLYNNGSLGTATLIGAEAVEGKYAYGSELTLTVTPNEGNKIDKVEVNGKKVALEEGKYTFTVKEDVSIYIVFKALPRYTVTVDDQTGADATITVSEPFDQNENHAYYDGEELTIEATDITTNYLVLVSLNGSEPEAIKESEGKYVWTHTVTADAKITVTVLRSYYVTVENVPVVVGDNGETAVGGKVERQLAEGTEEVKDWYRENEDVTLVITPNDGFRISKITVKGNGDPQVTEYTDYIAHSVELPKETCTVTVEYVAIYEISVNVAGIDGVENASVVLTVVDTATKEHHIKDLETLTESAEKTYTLDVGTSMKAEYTAPVTHRVGLDPHIPGVSFGGMAYMTPGANDVGTYTFSFIYSGGSLSVSYELYTHTVTVDGQLQEAPVTNSESYKLPAQPDPQYGLNGLNKNYEYTFTWVVNGVEYAAEATVENVRKDLVVTSKWSAQLSVEKSVTGTPEGGSVDWGNLQDASTLIEGTEFDVTIVVPQGYRAIVKAYAHTKDALSGSEGKSNFASGVYQAKTEDLTAHFKDTVRAGLKLEVEITYEKIFTVTVTENENVDVVILSHGDYNNDYFTVGNVFEFTVTAHEGYRVTAVKANDTVLDLVDGKYSHTLTGETTITIATVQTATVNYTVTGGENGTVSVTLADGSTVESGTTLDVGTVLKVEITANAGYTINATVAGTDYSKQSKVSVDDLALGAGGVTITVTFEKLPTHTVTVTEDEGASHTLSAAHFGEEGYYEGEEVTLTVTVENGYKLVSVDVAGAEETHDGTTYTFTMGTDNVTVTITVEKLYTVTVAGDSSENAQVAIEDQKEWYEANTTVNFTVTVDDGYAIQSVTATGSDVTPVDAEHGKYSVTVTNANVEIKVETVKLAEVTLTVTGGDATNVILTNGEAPVETGDKLPVDTKLTLKITVPEGYKVKYTLPGSADSQESYEDVTVNDITVADGGITISVEFVKVYTVTVAEGSEEHATVTFEPANEHGYESETKVTVTVAAVGEYVIESVTASAGELVDNKDGTYTLTVTENITITVTVLPKLSVNFPAPNPDEPSTSSAPEQGTWEAMDGANSIKIGENTITINGKPVTKIESNGKTDGTVVYTLTTDEGDYTMAWFGEAEGYILMLTDPTAAVSVSRRAVKTIAGGVSYYVNPKYVSEQGHHDAFKETDSDKLVGIDWTADESPLSVTNENGVHVTLDDEPATYVFAVEAGHYLFVIGASAYDLTLAEDGSTLTVNETTYSKPAPVEKIISVDSARLSGALIVLVVTVQNYTGDNLKVKVKLVCGDAEYNPIGANVYGAELNHQFELHFNQIVDLGTGTYALSLKDGETVYDTIPLGDSTHGEGNNKTFDLQANDGKLNLVVADNTPAPTKGIDNIHNGTLAGDGTIDFFANLNGFTADDLNDINGAKLVVGGEYELSLKNTFSTLDNNPVHFMFTIGDKITTAIGEQDLSLKIGETTYPLQNANGTWQGTYETGSLHFALSNSPNNQAKLTVTEKSAEYTVTINEVGDLADGFNFAHLFRKGTADVDEEMSSGSKVKTGDELTLKVTVRSGYTATVQVTGATLVDNGENSYTINEITGNVTITITYTKEGETPVVDELKITKFEKYSDAFVHLVMSSDDLALVDNSQDGQHQDYYVTVNGKKLSYDGWNGGYETAHNVQLNVYLGDEKDATKFTFEWYNADNQLVARATYTVEPVTEKTLGYSEVVSVREHASKYAILSIGVITKGFTAAELQAATLKNIPEAKLVDGSTYNENSTSLLFFNINDVALNEQPYEIILVVGDQEFAVTIGVNPAQSTLTYNGKVYTISSTENKLYLKVESETVDPDAPKNLQHYGEEAAPNGWSYYNEGRTVTTATEKDGVVTVTFSGNQNGNWWGLQVFYKQADIKAGDKITVSFTITSTVAGKIRFFNENEDGTKSIEFMQDKLTLNFNSDAFVVNSNNTVVKLYMAIDGQTRIDAATITISDLQIEKITDPEPEKTITFSDAKLQLADGIVYLFVKVDSTVYTTEELGTMKLFDGEASVDLDTDKSSLVANGQSEARFALTAIKGNDNGSDRWFWTHVQINGEKFDGANGDLKPTGSFSSDVVSSAEVDYHLHSEGGQLVVICKNRPAVTDPTYEVTKVELVSEGGNVYFVVSGTYKNYSASDLEALLKGLDTNLQHVPGAAGNANLGYLVLKQVPYSVEVTEDGWTYKFTVTVGTEVVEDGEAAKSTTIVKGTYVAHVPTTGVTNGDIKITDATDGFTVECGDYKYQLVNKYGASAEKQYWGCVGLLIYGKDEVVKQGDIDYSTIKLEEVDGKPILSISGTHENCTEDDFKFDLELSGAVVHACTVDLSQPGKFTVTVDLSDVGAASRYIMHLKIAGVGDGNVANKDTDPDGTLVSTLNISTKTYSVVKMQLWGSCFYTLKVEDSAAPALSDWTAELAQENGSVYLKLTATAAYYDDDLVKKLAFAGKDGGLVVDQPGIATLDGTTVTIMINVSDIAKKGNNYLNKWWRAYLTLDGNPIDNPNCATKTEANLDVGGFLYELRYDNGLPYVNIKEDTPVPQETYTVTFDVDGDTSSVQPQTYEQGQTFEAPDPAPEKADYTFLYWYYKQGEEEVKVEEGFIPSEHATENALTLYAKFEHELYGHQFPEDGGLCLLCGKVTGWNKEVEVGVKGDPTSTDTWITSRENGVGKAYDPADSERFGAIVPGQKAIVVGKLSAATVQVNNSWLNMHGILFGLGGIWLRDDAFIDHADAAYMHWTTQITSTLNDSVTDWAKVVALRADADLVLTYDWTSAEKIVITLVITGNDGADVYKQVYTISATDGHSLAKVYGIGIAPEYGYFKGTIYVIGEKETVGADECNPYVHIHSFDPATGKCECGAINPEHAHTYVNGQCTLCGAVQKTDLTGSGFTADSYSETPSDFQANMYGDNMLPELSNVGDKAIIIGSVKGNPANVWNGFAWELTNLSSDYAAENKTVWTGRCDAYGWFFGTTFSAWTDAWTDASGLSAPSDEKILNKQNENIALSDEILKAVIADGTWRIEIEWTEAKKVTVRVSCTANSGAYEGYTHMYTANLVILDSVTVTKLGVHVGGDTCENISVLGHQLISAE